MPQIIGASTYHVKVGDYTIIKNVQFIGGNTTNPMLTGAPGLLVYNCVFVNTYNSTGAATTALAGTNGRFVFCKFTTTGTGRGVSLISNAGVRFVSCTFVGFRNSGALFTSYSDNASADGCVFIDCNKAVVTDGNSINMLLTNNTFYDCDTAVSIAAGHSGATLVNNIINESSQFAVIGPADYTSGLFISNHLDTAATSNYPKTGIDSDYLLTVGDPLFVNPPDSLQLDTGSPCLNTGTGPK
jgi:hypothetical protein